MYGIIYRVTGPTGLVYIGQTTESLKERKRKHQYRAHIGDRRDPFHIALTLGFSLFTWDQIDIAESAGELDTKEKQYIAQYQSDNPAHGYNGTSGGVNTTYSQETRQKMSLAQKGSKAPWYGKHFSVEHRKAISRALKGKKRGPMPEAHRQAISAALKGRKGKPHTAASRRKISAARKRQVITPKPGARSAQRLKGGVLNRQAVRVRNSRRSNAKN